MIEYIQQTLNDKEGSFLHQFDLIAGTSVGGVCALLSNYLDFTNT
jgi:patatin-like phospholipase/acyl hydrolase